MVLVPKGTQGAFTSPKELKIFCTLWEIWAPQAIQYRALFLFKMRLLSTWAIFFGWNQPKWSMTQFSFTGFLAPMATIFAEWTFLLFLFYNLKITRIIISPIK